MVGAVLSFLFRLTATLLLLPLCIVLGSGTSLARLWENYESPWAKVARLRSEAKQRAEELERIRWLDNHPMEAARIEEERHRRHEAEQERQRRHEAEYRERRAELVAKYQKRQQVEQAALEAALATPLSEEKQQLLAEMPFPPRIEDLRRLVEEQNVK